MMVVILGVLFAMVAAIGTAVPAAIVEVRQGREAFLAAAATAAARAGLADSLFGPWTIAAQSAPVGTITPLRPLVPGAGFLVERVAVRLTGAVWLLSAEASVRDQGGGRIAQATEGLLIRLALFPSDSFPRILPITRPWISAFQ